ncbi:MAG TPA: hypothetical protein VK618_00285 [Flavitalea sp.]|nr:hypothetical protein [Flavitalea sp.]
MPNLKYIMLFPVLLFFAACSKNGGEEDSTDGPVRPVLPSSNKFISKVFEYSPAPGQFINESTGSKEGADAIVGNINSILSLGAFGGYVVFGFDHSILNNAGIDFAIYGNPFPPPTEWSEPGIVMVSRDANRNGIPDDEWFELEGSGHADPETIRNYQITYVNPGNYASVSWSDNQGNSGTVDTNSFHMHNYYPEFIQDQDSVTYTGTRLKSTFGQESAGAIYRNLPFAEGYADSWSTGDDFSAKGYNSFDIDKAVDNDFSPAQLKNIDFIKVYTAQVSAGTRTVGEVSTEIRGATDLSIP